MDTLLLNTFCEVARRGSITSAAESLGYTQSAISRQISSLEAAAGARLLHRRARGVVLTRHGERFLSHAEALLRRLEVARLDLRTLDRPDDRLLRVGGTATATAALIPLAVAAYAVTHPCVSVAVVEAGSRRQLQDLEDGEVEIAVLEDATAVEVDKERFELVHLVTEADLVALARSHRLADRSTVRFAELAEEQWIPSGTSEEDAEAAANLPPGPVTPAPFAVHQWSSKLGLVAAGLAVAMVPWMMVTLVPGGIALLPLALDDQRTRRVYAATAKAREPGSPVDEFLPLLKRHATALSATATAP